MGQNITTVGWLKLQWVEVPHSVKSSTFLYDFRWTNSLSTLGGNVTVIKRSKVKVSQ
jgi:hypothetical protein